MVSVFVQWCSLLCLSVYDIVQTHQQTLLFDVDQHHQQTNTIGVSKSVFMLVALLGPVFVPFVLYMYAGVCTSFIGFIH